MPSFSSSLENCIHDSLRIANDHAHELATLEHLLLALTKEPDAAIALVACGVDLKKLFKDLSEFVSNDLSGLTAPIAGSEAVPTQAFQRVIQRAAIHVQSSGRSEVSGANVLVAVFAERESSAAYFLQEQGATRYDVVNFVAHGETKIGANGADLEKLANEIISELPEYPTLDTEDREQRVQEAMQAAEKETNDGSHEETKKISKNLIRNSSVVAIQARSIQLLIREEVETLRTSRPNFKSDEEAAVFASRLDFLEEILKQLDDLIASILNLGEDKEAGIEGVAQGIQSIRDSIYNFTQRNSEAVFWGAQMPAMLGFVAMFSAAGANMATATPLVMSLCGGDRIIKLLKSLKN